MITCLPPAPRVDRQHLECDGSVEAKITRQVNGADATAPELALDRIAVAKSLLNIG